MSTDDISVTAIMLKKCSKSKKHRIHSHDQSTRKSRIEQFQMNRTMTANNRLSSKLPNVTMKSNVNSSNFESMIVKRNRSSETNRLTSSPSKLERQSTIINLEKRLPILYSLRNENDQKQMSEFRRRQIYALNHFMRHLEQEQFRQFCQTYDINMMKSDNAYGEIDDTMKNLST